MYIQIDQFQMGSAGSVVHALVNRTRGFSMQRIIETDEKGMSMVLTGD